MEGYGWTVPPHAPHLGQPHRLPHSVARLRPPAEVRVQFLYAKRGQRRPSKVYPDVIEATRDKDAVHPAQKPVGLLLNLLARSALPTDNVLDFCAGSCSTAIPLAPRREARVYLRGDERGCLRRGGRSDCKRQNEPRRRSERLPARVACGKVAGRRRGARRSQARLALPPHHEGWRCGGCDVELFECQLTHRPLRIEGDFVDPLPTGTSEGGALPKETASTISAPVVPNN